MVVTSGYYAGASRKLFVQEWMFSHVGVGKESVGVGFGSLGLDKAEWLEDIRKGSCSQLIARGGAIWFL